MNVEPELERRFLGMVEVDSGTLLIGDPLYCLPRADGGRPGIDYEAVIAAPDEPASYLGGRPVLLGPVWWRRHVPGVCGRGSGWWGRAADG